MSKILALIAAQWRVMVSYRTQTLLSFGGLLFTVVPLYFVAGALQPVMANAIRTEGGDAFGFLLVGTSVILVVTVALSAVPSALSSGIASGTFEALLSTPTSAADPHHRDERLSAPHGGAPCGSPPGGRVRSSASAWRWGNCRWRCCVLVVLVLAHYAVGLISGAMVLAFRTAGPLSRLVLVASSLLGGVYYPTHVIPSWLQAVSAVLPLSYGLRALRRVLLQGASLGAVSHDLLVLAGETAVLLALGIGLMALAFRYARRQGTLAQY